MNCQKQTQDSGYNLHANICRKRHICTVDKKQTQTCRKRIFITVKNDLSLLLLLYILLSLFIITDLRQTTCDIKVK